MIGLLFLAIALVIYAGADIFELMTIDSLESYQKYLGDKETGGQNWVATILGIIELATFILIMKNKIWTDDLIKLLFTLLLMGIFVKIATIGKDGAISRLTAYYGVASLFALPYMLKEIKSQEALTD